MNGSSETGALRLSTFAEYHTAPVPRKERNALCWCDKSSHRQSLCASANAIRASVAYNSVIRRGLSHNLPVRSSCQCKELTHTRPAFPGFCAGEEPLRPRFGCWFCGLAPRYSRFGPLRLPAPAVVAAPRAPRAAKGTGSQPGCGFRAILAARRARVAEPCFRPTPLLACRVE